MPAPKRPAAKRAARRGSSSSTREPAVDGGKFPAKRCVGDVVTVTADVFRDGHDILRAVVKYRGPGDNGLVRGRARTSSTRTSAACAGAGGSRSTAPGRWEYTVEAWTDVFATWRDELERKVLAAQDDDLSGELSEGAVLLQDAAGRADGRSATAS